MLALSWCRSGDAGIEGKTEEPKDRGINND
jgi:hypothetical protein